jgi:hypothetical protein
MVPVDRKHIGEEGAFFQHGSRLSLEESNVLGDFVLYPYPGQREELAVGYFYLIDDFITEKDLVVAQAALVLHAIEAVTVPEA